MRYENNAKIILFKLYPRQGADHVVDGGSGSLEAHPFR